MSETIKEHLLYIYYIGSITAKIPVFTALFNILWVTSNTLCVIIWSKTFMNMLNYIISKNVECSTILGKIIVLIFMIFWNITKKQILLICVSHIIIFVSILSRFLSDRDNWILKLMISLQQCDLWAYRMPPRITGILAQKFPKVIACIYNIVWGFRLCFKLYCS